jgi:hypothetical protein
MAWTTFHQTDVSWAELGLFVSGTVVPLLVFELIQM